MNLFRRRKEVKSEAAPVPPTTSPSKTASQRRRAATSTSGSRSPPQAPTYRHLPSRAAADARNIKLPRASVDGGHAPIQHLHKVRSAPLTNNPNPASARQHIPAYATSNNKHPSPTAKGKENAIPGTPVPNITISNVTSPPAAAPITAPSNNERPRTPRQTGPYRHVPTHAATDAFLTSAGTHVGWHKARIQRLTDHSRRLSIALSNPAVAQAKMQRFPSSSTVSTMARPGLPASGSSGANSSGSAATTGTSAASVRSIDAVLCVECNGTGMVKGKRCRKHGSESRSGGSRSKESAWSGGVMLKPAVKAKQVSNPSPIAVAAS